MYTKRKGLPFTLLAGVFLGSTLAILNPYAIAKRPAKELIPRYFVWVEEFDQFGDPADPHVFWPELPMDHVIASLDTRSGRMHMNKTPGPANPHIHLATFMDFANHPDRQLCFEDADGDGVPDEFLEGTNLFIPDDTVPSGVVLQFNVNARDRKGANQFYRLDVIGGIKVFDHWANPAVWNPTGVDNQGNDIFPVGDVWTLVLDPQDPGIWQIVPKGNKKNACQDGGLFPPHTIVFYIGRIQ